jgi:hypothetical protein
VRHKPGAPSAKPAPAAAIQVNIGRITLDAVSPSEKHRVQAALEANLVRLGPRAAREVASRIMAALPADLPEKNTNA